MDNNKIEQFQREYPSEETFSDEQTERTGESWILPHSQWNMETIPYPPRFQRIEIKRIEVELYRKINRMIWKRKENTTGKQQNRETEEKTVRYRK